MIESPCLAWCAVLLVATTGCALITDEADGGAGNADASVDDSAASDATRADVVTPCGPNDVAPCHCVPGTTSDCSACGYVITCDDQGRWPMTCECPCGGQTPHCSAHGYGDLVRGACSAPLCVEVDIDNIVPACQLRCCTTPPAGRVCSMDAGSDATDAAADSALDAAANTD